MRNPAEDQKKKHTSVNGVMLHLKEHQRKVTYLLNNTMEAFN